MIKSACLKAPPSGAHPSTSHGTGSEIASVRPDSEQRQGTLLTLRFGKTVWNAGANGLLLGVARSPAVTLILSFARRRGPKKVAPNLRTLHQFGQQVAIAL